MSLYNMVHGFDPAAPMILKALRVDPRMLPRFRDAYFDWQDEAGKVPKMVVLTRTGGGNRADYQEQNAALTQLPGFISDCDDNFDSTFAIWSYAVPLEIYNFAVEYLTKMGKPKTLKEKTLGFVDEMKSGAAKMPLALEDLFEKIKSVIEK